MHVPKWMLIILGALGAMCVGWTLHGTVAGATTRPVTPVSADFPLASGASDPSVYPANAPPVHLTVVTPQPGAPTASPGVYVTQDDPSGGQRLSNGSRWPALLRAGTGQRRSAVRSAVSAGANPSSQSIQAPGVVNGINVIANGDHIVVATDGSIISVGDNTVVKGNTGDASSSAAIAIDVAQSDLGTGDSQVTTGAQPAPESSAASDGDSMLPPDASAPTPPGPGGATPGTRSTAIAGWDDNTIGVSGSNNLVTYDDSNVFVDRTGNLNGNTGDTGTSGLNVVDSVGSSVRSGQSETSGGGTADRQYAAQPGSVLGAGGSGAYVGGAETISTANAADSLVIGADGVDLRSVRVAGSNNIVTYDDGNAAVGGSGNVNAQVGDSDTSGTVVMGIRDSTIQAGDSVNPSSADRAT